MSKERALDIFVLLDQLDRKNYELWETLTDEQRKEFAPLVVTRWMAGCDDAFQIVMLNEVMNIAVFPLGDRKSLLMRLLTVCSSGRRKRYKWVNFKTGGTKQCKRAIELIAATYHLSRSEAADTLKLFKPDELIALAEETGWQKDEIKELQKELK